MSGDAPILIAIAALIALAAFLALAETSITRMGRVKAQTLADDGRRGAAHLLKLVENPERALNPILFLVLVCHLLAATLVGVVAERRFGPTGVAVAAFFEVVVIFVFAEAAPKTWAIQHAERAALLAAPFVAFVSNFFPLRILTRALIGFSNVILPGKGLSEGPFVSEEELKAMADAAAEGEAIESGERHLIHSILEFGDTVVREVMVHRTDMVAVEARDTIADVLDVAITAGKSRLPCYELNVDDITGIIFTKDLMKAVREGKGEQPSRELAREAHFVPETKRVAELMPEMQRDKFHMAIVVDEYGGTAGIVTLEDLIEELVGEITDEFDEEEPGVEQLPDGDVLVSARMPIDEVNSLLDADFSEGDWDTIGGLVYSCLGHVPTEGEVVEADGHRLTAEKVQGRRIGRVRIQRISVEEVDESVS